MADHLVRGDPLYRRLANRIRDAINTGEYVPGGMLPSEAELAERYGVSRPTVRQGLAALRTEGLITVRMGKGYFVRRLDRPATLHQRRIRRDADGFHQDDAAFAETRPPTHYRTAADAHEAEVLGIAEGEALFAADRLMTDTTSGTLWAYRTFLPFAVAEGTPLETNPFPKSEELYAILAEAGHALTWEERVRARMPVADEAADLNIPDATPILVTERVTYGAEGRPLVIEETRTSAETTAFAYRLTEESVPAEPS